MTLAQDQVIVEINAREAKVHPLIEVSITHHVPKEGHGMSISDLRDLAAEMRKGGYVCSWNLPKTIADKVFLVQYTLSPEIRKNLTMAGVSGFYAKLPYDVELPECEHGAFLSFKFINASDLRMLKGLTHE